MNDSNYSPSLVSALKIARGMALQDKHNTFGVSHLVMAMFAENTGLKEILSSMQKDVGYIMEWFDTHREMYRSSGTSTEEVEPDEELSKVLDAEQSFQTSRRKDHLQKNGGGCQDEGDSVQERIHRSLLGNSGRK